jgi:hypothetical protein
MTVLIGMALAVAGPGCRSCDKVESELRTREGQLRETREELERVEAYNQALQQELQVIRGAAPGAAPAEACQPVPIYPVRSLTLGRQTGGLDKCGGPGDDSLQIVVEPRDPENQAIKVPGSLVVQVVEISREGLKSPLSRWDVPAEQLQRCWRNGLLSTGYTVVLPWKVWPSTEKLRVTVVFRLTDGRVFEADKDVTVRLPPGAPRHPALPSPDPVLPAPLDHDLLPVPRPVEVPPGASAPAPTTARFAPVRMETPVPFGRRPAVELLRPISRS